MTLLQSPSFFYRKANHGALEECQLTDACAYTHHQDQAREAEVHAGSQCEWVVMAWPDHNAANDSNVPESVQDHEVVAQVATVVVVGSLAWKKPADKN